MFPRILQVCETVTFDGRRWTVESDGNGKILELYIVDRPQDIGVPFDRTSFVAKGIAKKLGLTL